MLRRTALGALFGGGSQGIMGAVPGLRAFFGSAHGAGLVLDFRTRRLVAVEGADLARKWLLPPGSTLKPFSLLALLEARKLTANEQFPCPLKLSVSGRSLACSHPPLAVPMDVSSAIAYSCNCFVAHVARRFASGELARSLVRSGFSSRTALLGDQEASGQVEPAYTAEASQLQALGEYGVLVTPLELLTAYLRLASAATRAEMASIMEGLEGAVEYGTARLARVPGVKVAGKTGSVRTSGGVNAAWFSGFAPSRAPSVVVTVVVQGRSGGADAAPIAGQILGAHLAGRL
jgi:cell division protein FtsI/penicillin-binding protein 2